MDSSISRDTQDAANQRGGLNMPESRKDTSCDLFVIGAGSGGVRASRVAASLGAKVFVAEDLYLGGTCVNVGCVPKKLYVYGSEFGKAFQDASGFGWRVTDATFDWPTLRDNKSREISRLNSIYERLLDGSGATVIDGRARVVGPHTVDVDGVEYQAERILLATGSWPTKPAFSGSELAITSNEIFDLETFPERLLVIGGGYIATEFAGIFNGLGSQVTQLYRGELFMRGFDGDVRRFAAQEIQKTGDFHRIPLLNRAEEIINLYKDEAEITGKLLPLRSNQKVNAYLKVIADLCQIEKTLTFHMARHTFATTVTLANNVSIEVVSKMLGHKDIATTQIYAKVLNESMTEFANLLNQKL